MDSYEHREVNMHEILVLSVSKQDEHTLIKSWYSMKNWIEEIKNMKPRKKSDKLAEMIKEKGNFAYSMTEFQVAMKLYADALLLANKNSKIYGAILANISSCLFEMRLYKKCIRYIDWCLATPYPNNSRPKLYLRKIKALSIIGEKSCAAEVNSQFKKFMNKCKINFADEEFLGKYIKLAEEALRVPEAYDMGILEDLTLPEFEENPMILNMSKSVTLKYNKQYGRHIVAQAPIKKGECILMEKPYAFVGYSRCPNCFKYIKNIVICEQCPGLIYCSEVCREQDNEIHKWECKLYQLEKFCALDETIRLAFRVFLKGIQSGYKNNTSKIEEELRFGNETDNFPYVRQINGRISQIPIEKKVFLLDGCCVILGYINTDKDLKEWIRSKIGSDIGKHLLQLIVKCKLNARACTDVDNLFSNSLYPTLSLFNHSCVANTLLFYYEDRLLLKASKDINPGEQIYYNYIMLSMEEMSLEAKQQALLTQYGVTCKCTLCTKDNGEKGILPCPKCNFYADESEDGKLKCRKCRTSIILSWDIILKMKTITDSEQLYVLCKDINLLKESIKAAQDLQVNPKCFVMSEIYLKFIHECIKTGHLDESANYLQYIRNIESCLCFSNVELFAALKVFVKMRCSSNEWSITKYKNSTIIAYEEHLAFLEEYCTHFYPSQSILRDIKKLQMFFRMQKQITEFKASLDWIK